MAQKFAPTSLRHNKTGDVVNGEFVVETHTAWQVAVGGKVQVFMKDEWTPVAPSNSSPFPNLFDPFGGMFSGGGR